MLGSDPGLRPVRTLRPLPAACSRSRPGPRHARGSSDRSGSPPRCSHPRRSPSRRHRPRGRALRGGVWASAGVARRRRDERRRLSPVRLGRMGGRGAYGSASAAGICARVTAPRADRLLVLRPRPREAVVPPSAREKRVHSDSSVFLNMLPPARAWVAATADDGAPVYHLRPPFESIALPVAASAAASPRIVRASPRRRRGRGCGAAGTLLRTWRASPRQAPRPGPAPSARPDSRP